MAKSDLLNDPLPKLFKQLAIPASIGFFFNTMYNVVDTYYAGLLGTQSLAALSISFPVFFLIISIAAGISQGTTALVANILGTKNTKKSALYSSQALSFAFLLGIGLSIVGLLISPFLFKLLGASGAYLETALDYMNIIFVGSTLFVLNFTLNGIFNAHGDMKSNRNALIVGVLLNIILNPLFMFGYGFIPAMGIQGIALATIFVQILTFLYFLIRIKQHKILEKATFKSFTPKMQEVKEILRQGVPASGNMFTVAAGIFVITYFLGTYSQDVVAAYGVAVRIEQIFLLPTIGLNIATLSIVGQNNGAKQYKRVYETYITALKYGACLCVPAGIIMFFLRKPLIAIFAQSANVVQIGSEYLIFASFLLWFYVALFVSVSMLQGLKKPSFALWTGLFRQIIAPIIFFSITVFWLKMSVWAVWWGIAIIVFFAAIIMLFIAGKKVRSINDKLNEN